MSDLFLSTVTSLLFIAYSTLKQQKLTLSALETEAGLRSSSPTKFQNTQKGVKITVI